MTTQALRLAPLAIAALLIVGCAKETREEASAPAPSEPSASQSAPASSTAKQPAASAEPAAAAEPAAELPEQTGVKACDDYLANYKACHRVIGAYSPDAIDRKYDELRTNLLQRSTTEDGKKQIQNQCASLAATMTEALNDRECTAAAPAEPAPADESEG